MHCCETWKLCILLLNFSLYSTFHQKKSIYKFLSRVFVRRFFLLETFYFCGRLRFFLASGLFPSSCVKRSTVQNFSEIHSILLYRYLCGCWCCCAGVWNSWRISIIDLVVVVVCHCVACVIVLLVPLLLPWLWLLLSSCSCSNSQL